MRRRQAPDTMVTDVARQQDLAGQRLRHRLTGPAVAAAAALATAGLFVVFDPSRPSSLPSCPFRAMTGLDCPGCGSLRALHALVHGDVVAALDHNIVTTAAVPLLLLAWVLWLRRSVSGLPVTAVLDGRVVRVIAVGFVVFAVVRNLPGVPFLGSGVGWTS